MDTVNKTQNNRRLKDIGDTGEKQASDYLTRKGYKLLAKKFSTKFGEIDLVMEDAATLVFVEVKKRHADHYGPPEEAMTFFKKEHLARSAMIYIKRTGAIDRMVRFDVITIDSGGLRHYQDAFTVGDKFYY